METSHVLMRSVIDEYSSGGSSGGFGGSHGSSGGRRESFGDKMIDKAAEFAKKKW